MKSTIFAASLLASMAMASPLIHEKRYLVTETVMETATVTVTGDKGGWHNWGTNTPSASNTVTVIETTPTPEPTTTPEPEPSPVTTTVDTSSAPPSSSSEAPQPTNSLSDYAAPIMEQHNLHRSNHSVAALTWDDSLANIAQQIAASCVYAHDTKTGGGGYGQNIGAGAPPEEVNKMITNQMYNDEMMLYPGYGSEPGMDLFERWGHFSQIVWKGTERVGCFTQKCDDGLANTASNVSPYFTVCNYEPAGKFLLPIHILETS